MNDANLNSSSEKKRVAHALLKAVEAFTLRTTVLVAAGGDLNRLASALILRTEAGVPFLLTARHVLEDAPWQPLRLMVPGLGGRELFDVGANAEFAPARPQTLGTEPVDVAIVTLRPELHRELNPLAVGLDSIADDDGIAESDATFLVGFPTYLAFTEERAPNVTKMSMLTYATFVKDHDKHGRLEID